MLLATRWSHHAGKRHASARPIGPAARMRLTTYVALTQWDRNRTSNSPPGRLRRLSEIPQLRRRSATSNHEHRAQRHGYEKPESRSQAEDAGTAAASLAASGWVPAVAGRSAHRLLTEPGLIVSTTGSCLDCEHQAEHPTATALTDRHGVSAHRQAVNLPASPTLVRTQHLPHRGAPTSRYATGPRWFSPGDASPKAARSVARSGFRIVQSIGLGRA